MLTATNLTLWRGTRCLFEDLSLTVQRGQAAVVRGPNGSGKTTLLRVLAGLTRPESGTVSWGGDAIDSAAGLYRQALSYLGHATGLKGELTVEQNLSFSAAMIGTNPGSLAAAIDGLDLDALGALPVRFLSAGQRRRVAMARVLSSRATLWLLDEPLTNLDGAGREYVLSAIHSHLDAGGLAAVALHDPIELEPHRRVDVSLGGTE